MKIVKSPTIESTKKIMNLLLDCAQDENLSRIERNQYYKDYLKVAENLILLSK